MSGEGPDFLFTKEICCFGPNPARPERPGRAFLKSGPGLYTISADPVRRPMGKGANFADLPRKAATTYGQVCEFHPTPGAEPTHNSTNPQTPCKTDT